MADYVDRDLLLKVLIHRVKGNEDNFIVLGTNNTLALLEEWVRSVSAVDAVEVVRCKDCTEWDKKEQECSHWYGFREKDFCSYGERRADG